MAPWRHGASRAQENESSLKKELSELMDQMAQEGWVEVDSDTLYGSTYLVEHIM